MKFNLNGVVKHYDGDPELSLLDFLRDSEGIISVKDGCSPQAACGACSVEVDGKARLSCVWKMKRVEGSEVTTIEGMDQKLQDTFAHAFVEKSGVQCGFCIPGIVVQSKVLLDKNPDPSRAEVEKALTPNLCRCTGYKKVVDSVIYAGEAIREGREIPKPTGDGKVGSRLPKYNAEKLVLGQHEYVADIKIAGMLHGALKYSDHPRAKIISIDLSKAETMPGVVRVFTVKDIPGIVTTGLIAQDWPLMLGLGETTRYVGDVIAGVVAQSNKQAREAVAAIEIEYEVLKPITDVKEALKADSPQIHESGNKLSDTTIIRGDIEKALTESAYISTGYYETQFIEHGFMEPESCIAQPNGDGIEIFSQGQGVYEEQNLISKILGLDLEKVRIHQVSNGGGFGGKEDLTVQGHAALFAYILKKPVKVTLSRDESIRMHPKRHPLYMNYQVGCDANGKLTVVIADILGDTGAYASVGMKVLERAAGHATGAYNVPNAKILAKGIYTNNIPCGAMRGFGVNQTAFAIESCIDDLCEQGGFDRWQFRYDNALSEGDVTATGQIITDGVGLRETLLAVKEPFKAAKYAGIACGLKNTGIGNGMPDEGKVKIEILKNKVILSHGWTEMGQGVHTMAQQFLCTETGIDPRIIEIRVDTDDKAFAGMTTASRATSIIGNTIINVAKDLKNDLKTKSLDELVGKVYEGIWSCDWTTKPGKEVDKIITHYSYSYATQLVVLDDDGKIDTIYAAHDAGKIINPSLFEGQIEGAVHMGLGYAISEELVIIDGVPKSTRLRNMGILRAHETPKIEVIGIEVADPHGPHGAKGVGEIGLVPTAGAVANALYQYEGKRRYKLPMKEKVKKRA